MIAYVKPSDVEEGEGGIVFGKWTGMLLLALF